MGFADLFKATKNKELTLRVAELEAMLTPEMQDLDRVRTLIAEANTELQETQKHTEKMVADAEKQAAKITVSAQSDLDRLNKDIEKAQKKLTDLKKDLIETEDEILFQSFGIYKPRYEFATSTEYKDKLSDIRQQQKAMIKYETAVTGNKNWTVDGSTSKGLKMVKDMQKLLLRAFNSECDDCIEHVKFNNIEASEKRITTSKDAISKLGNTMQIYIAERYYKLKLEELYLSYEFQVKKQEEKEHLKQLRAEERERAKVEREIEEARKKIEKEQKHYSNALKKVLEQIASTTNASELSALNAKKAEMEAQLVELDKATEQIDYRAANQKAGYVYIISNIGAFGEGVYKIGMTRRLEPMDRVDELGDASVPFDFDVHALIFSDNAPALEAALHKAFEDKKLNMINTRREFFRVSLDEIKAVVKANYDKTVEFIDLPPAQQYRESLLISAGKR